MAEDWELKSLERRIQALEKKDERSAERRDWWTWHLVWTAYVVAITVYVVLAATGHLHHH